MNIRRAWNERTKVLLTMELAVILPAAALIGFSIWKLHSIQRDKAVDAASPFQGWLPGSIMSGLSFARMFGYTVGRSWRSVVSSHAGNLPHTGSGSIVAT